MKILVFFWDNLFSFLRKFVNNILIFHGIEKQFKFVRFFRRSAQVQLAVLDQILYQK